MKRIVLVMLSMLLLLSMSACGSKEDVQPQMSDAEAEVEPDLEFNSVNKDEIRFSDGYKTSHTFSYPYSGVLYDEKEILAIDQNHALLAYRYQEQHKKDGWYEVSYKAYETPKKLMDDVVCIARPRGTDTIYALKQDGTLYSFYTFSYSPNGYLEEGSTQENGRAFQLVKEMDNVRYIHNNTLITNDNRLYLHVKDNYVSQCDDVVWGGGIDYAEYILDLNGVLKSRDDEQAPWKVVADNVCYAVADTLRDHLYYVTQAGNAKHFTRTRYLHPKENGGKATGETEFLCSGATAVYPGRWVVSVGGELLLLKEKEAGSEIVSQEVVGFYWYGDEKILVTSDGSMYERNGYNGDSYGKLTKLASNICTDIVTYTPETKGNNQGYVGDYFVQDKKVMEISSMTENSAAITVYDLTGGSLVFDGNVPLKNKKGLVELEDRKYIVEFCDDAVLAYPSKVEEGEYARGIRYALSSH